MAQDLRLEENEMGLPDLDDLGLHASALQKLSFSGSQFSKVCTPSNEHCLQWQ